MSTNFRWTCKQNNFLNVLIRIHIIQSQKWKKRNYLGMIRINNTTIGFFFFPFFFFLRTAFKWFCLPAQVCLFQVCSASESPSKVRNERVLTMATACSIVLPASSFIEYLNFKVQTKTFYRMDSYPVQYLGYCTVCNTSNPSDPFNLMV